MSNQPSLGVRLMAQREAWRARAKQAEAEVERWKTNLADRAELSHLRAVAQRVRALAAEFQSERPNKIANVHFVAAAILAALDSSETPPDAPEPGPIERSREQARAEVELVQRWWLRDAQGWRYRMAGPQAAQEAKAKGLAGTPPEELTVCWDFEFRPFSSRMFEAPPFPGAAPVPEERSDGCPACGKLHFPWCAPHGGPGYAPEISEDGFAVGDWVLVDIGEVVQQRGEIVNVVPAEGGGVWEYDVRVRDGEIVAAQPAHVHPDYTRSDSGLPVDGETP